MIKQEFKTVEEIHNQRMTDEPLNEEVKIWVDESLISKDERQKRFEDKLEKEEGISVDAKRSKSFELQLEKDERIQKLRVGIDSGRIKKFEDAVKYLQVSRTTVDNYLKEIGYGLYDMQKRLHGINTMQKGKNSRKKNLITYYDKDPNKNDAKVITQEEHKQRIYDCM